jgi:hypothetical protein
MGASARTEMPQTKAVSSGGWRSTKRFLQHLANSGDSGETNDLSLVL